jgi:hypothetical protein
VLEPDHFRHYAETFNRDDEQLVTNAIPNAASWEWMRSNIPWFECADRELEEIYYFRWWTYRQQIKRTPGGYIITEFLPPVPWAGKYNSISCAAGHHIYEGRWLRDPEYVRDYIRFWFRGGGSPRVYSCWLADALYNACLVTGEWKLAVDLLPDLKANYGAWERSRFDTSAGLFWQEDGQDGMEVSIGGSGFRAPLNSYMYGDALAIARIARKSGDEATAKAYEAKAATLRESVLAKLWDPEARFFKVLPRAPGARLAATRELHGYTPWYFDLPGKEYAVAWRQLTDPHGFWAPYGPTTAEQRDAHFAVSYQGHECQWNGPSWPYSTSVTLTALAKLLNGPPQEEIGKQDYFNLLRVYAKSQHRRREDGRVTSWIDENLNPFTGDWLSRTRLKTWNHGTWSAEKGGVERGKNYNHSTFNDLIITGLVGLRPSEGGEFQVNPLVPAGELEYFCLDDVPYRNSRLTILWDRNGERYHRGAGLRVLRDGVLAGSSDKLERITIGNQ